MSSDKVRQTSRMSTGMQRSWTRPTLDSSTKAPSTARKLSKLALKELKNLQFTNPGPRMQNVLVVTPPGNMENESMRLRVNQLQPGMLYDSEGKLLTGEDYCDCTQPFCPGCFFPCKYCGSNKCGVVCRCDRKWIYKTKL